MAIVEKTKNNTKEDKEAKKEILPADDPAKKEWLKIVERPILTEKSSNLNAESIYVFKVGKKVSKQQIKMAVKKLYNVDPISVRTVTIPKKKRMRGRIEGYKPGLRKAMVKLKKGQTIELQ